MEKDRYDLGVPSWVDLGTPDLPGARTFYGALFGWETPEGPAEAGGYTVCMRNGKAVAGLGPQMNPGPPAWMMYVNVDGADAAVGLVKANGGTVLADPFDVMTAGRMAVVADPQGAVLGIWEPREHAGAQLINEPDTYAWNELMTTDVNAAKTFYGAVFGWAAETEGEGASAYVIWKLHDQMIGGMTTKPDTVPAEAPPSWSTFFLVADADDAVARVAELGGSLVTGPVDVDGERLAVVRDPAGAVFNVFNFTGPEV